MNIIFSTSDNPERNLATEKKLFSESEEEFLFLYVNAPCVVLGFNQAIENEVDVKFCAENNIQLIKRLSGGGAVYHDEGNLNYSFISNKKEFPLSADFLIPIVEVLTLMKIPVEIGKRKDLWLDGSKISGTASHISKGRELHHGTLLYDTNLDTLQRALTPKTNHPVKNATKSVQSPVKNIRDFLSEKDKNTLPAASFFQLIFEKLIEFQNIKEKTNKNKR